MSDYRQESRARWGVSAKAWEAHAKAMRRDTMPVSSWMVDALGPQPGDTLLELAAGPGETGFLAAELIRPGGTLISSDISPEMLSVAQRRGAELGLDNVRFKQIDADSSIDIEAASIDGVLCRWGYMLMADPNTALRETRRVLKAGGRVALAAWASPEDNRWVAIPGRELVRRGLVEPVNPDEPGQFTWAPEGVIAEQLADAGFVEYEIDAVHFVLRYESFEDFWETQSSMSGRMRDALAGADPAVVEDLREAVRAQVQPAGDGAIELPARTWVAVATA
jgi:ubiquinone/menaquinone biosynthesis C-methylase UbiE